MQDLVSMISTLRRPALLIRAARFGVEDYDRGRHLTRILKTTTPPRPGAAVVRLIEMEADLETRRQGKAAEYSVARHLDVLIALLGEARVLRASYERQPAA